jgi:hypothetical protein
MKTALDILRDELQEMVDTRSEIIAYGEVADFPAYKYLAGVITGLTLARERVLDLQKLEEDM